MCVTLGKLFEAMESKIDGGQPPLLQVLPDRLVNKISPRYVWSSHLYGFIAQAYGYPFDQWAKFPLHKLLDHEGEARARAALAVHGYEWTGSCTQHVPMTVMNRVRFLSKVASLLNTAQRVCDTCDMAKSLDDYSLYSRGWRKICDACLDAGAAPDDDGAVLETTAVVPQMTTVTPTDKEIANVTTAAKAPAREDALTFAIAKLTEQGATIAGLLADVSQRDRVIAGLQEEVKRLSDELEYTKLELAELTEAAAPQAVTHDELTALASFGYRPAA